MAASRPRALITGASSGIGAAYAEHLARDGYDLVLVARRRDRLTELAERLRRESAIEAEPLAADLTDATDLAQVEAQLAADERLTLLINNAGFGGYRPFVEVAPEVIDALVAIHIRVVARLTHVVLPGMMRRGAGGIINVASLLALSGSMPPDPLPYRAMYAGAKAFIVTFTEALAGELKATGVRVQVCLPGLVDTEFHAAVGRDRSQMPSMMKSADLVAASLAGLARGEVTCIPALEDATLLDKLAEAQRTVLLASAMRPSAASRYHSPLAEHH
jgi:short-subunit dehydrogenase